MSNEKKHSKVNYGFYYSYEQDKVGSYTYQYPYCYVVDDDVLTGMKKIMHMLSDEPGFIIANAKFKAGVLFLKYSFICELSNNKGFFIALIFFKCLNKSCLTSSFFSLKYCSVKYF